MEKMSQKTRQTRRTLKMLGIAYMRALTTIRIPCHLDIARNGRKARNVRSERNTFKFSFSSISKLKTDTLSANVSPFSLQKYGHITEIWTYVYSISCL